MYVVFIQEVCVYRKLPYGTFIHSFRGGGGENSGHWTAQYVDKANYFICGLSWIQNLHSLSKCGNRDQSDLFQNTEFYDINYFSNGVGISSTI
jgi:hypothetical protein